MTEEEFWQQKLEDLIQLKMQRAREDLEIHMDPIQQLFRPAFELVVDHSRDITPQDTYDLQCRWVDAGNACGWEGAIPTYERMAALVVSPIWKALGDGVGGHDAMGVPYPPFFHDGWKWGWRTLKGSEWEALCKTYAVQA
jgi:hypothetical protein